MVSELKKVVVVGQGYVGLPVAMRAYEAGYDVIGLDTDKGRIDRLTACESFVEDISDDQLAAARESGRYTPTTDASLCEDFAVAVITVPTPLREGAPDLSYIEQSTRTLGTYLRAGACVVLESTTYPGTTNELVRPLLETASGLTAGVDFHLGYSPERIDPGNTRHNFVNTPKVVSGVSPASLEHVEAFYGNLVERTVPVSAPEIAELVKLLENTFRHVNIALVNELAMFAAELGIDVWEAIDAASTKPFGYMRFTPGPGVGGHCLPVDPSYLSWRVKQTLGHSFRFVELANDVNDHMPAYVVRRVWAGLNRLGQAVNGSRVLVLGLAYKPNTSDARESPASAVIEGLLALGAEVRVCDPLVPLNPGSSLTRVALTEEELAAAHAVVMLTDHDVYDTDLIVRHASYVLDTRRCLTGPAVEHL